MKFINAKPLVNHALENSYAVPAFNTNGGTYDVARAALEACQELQAPLILQVYEPNCRYRGFGYFVNLANFLCDELKTTIPVALHLDHGHSLESITAAVEAGFTSVMFDASHEPVDINIKKTQEVIKFARNKGVSIEAEIGYVKGNEPSKTSLTGRIAVPHKPTLAPVKTDPAEAEKFARAAGVDMLAVSIGTTHGVYEIQDEIDYSLLEQLGRQVNIPLVQHGTCGISNDNLSKLSKAGMAKINFGEPFRFNYIKYFNELTDCMEHLWHPWRIMREISLRLKEDMKELILSLNAEGKAEL